MKFDPKSNVKENYSFLSEQSVIGAPLYVAPFETDREKEERAKREEEKRANEYPNYCSYPDKTVLPGKNEVGASGLDAIPEGYCCYASPARLSKEGGTNAIFIPYNAEKIWFWDETNFDLFLKNHMKKNNYPESWLPGLTKYYLKIFPFGTVRNFIISGVTYNTRITPSEGEERWVFNWYFSENGKKPYPTIKWTDPRNTWDKIVDDFGDAAQWVAAVAFFIGGFFTEGGTWLLLAELVTEGTLGIISAQRRLEKGENIAAAFDLIFGLTPFMKTGKFFTGIDMDIATRLTSSMRRAGLTKSSTPEQIINWYRGLSEVEQKTWSKMVHAADEFSEAKLKKVLGEGLNDLTKYLRANPGLIKNVKFYQNVSLREFTLTGVIGLLDILAETFYGDKLDDLQKKKITTIYNNAEQISQELANEVKMNLIYNSDKLKEILNSEPTNQMLKDLDIVPDSPIHADWFNTEFKNAVESSGGQYFENPSDSSKSIENIKTSEEEVTKYESEGYKKNTDMTDDEWAKATNPIKLNGVWYYKVK